MPSRRNLSRKPSFMASEGFSPWPPLNPECLPEWHQRHIHDIRENPACGNISQCKKHLSEMPLHTWKFNSHAWLFIWKSVTNCPWWTAPSVYSTVPQQTTSGNAEPSIFRQHAFFSSALLDLHPCLLFTPLSTCILFHAFINASLPCPHLGRNKRSCRKSMSSELRTRGEPCAPFRATGHGLAECNLKSNNTFQTGPQVRMRTGLFPASQGLKWKGLVLFTLGEKGWQTVILHQGLQRRKKAERRFCFHFQISELSQGRRSGGRCGWVSRRVQTGIASCVCPLGSVTHTSPWLNWKACAPLTDWQQPVCTEHQHLREIHNQP